MVKMRGWSVIYAAIDNFHYQKPKTMCLTTHYPHFSWTSRLAYKFITTWQFEGFFWFPIICYLKHPIN
jgi:hypothetical protein